MKTHERRSLGVITTADGERHENFTTHCGRNGRVVALAGPGDEPNCAICLAARLRGSYNPHPWAPGPAGFRV